MTDLASRTQPEMSADPDVIVIGAGQNGLVAAVLLARAGLSVLVLEASEAIGGAVKTVEWTPGFRFDPCGAFFPFSLVGPISELPLEAHGVEWCFTDRPLAGGTPDGPGVVQLRGSLDATAAEFDRACPGDGAGWRELYDFWEWGGAALLSLLFNPIGHPAPFVRGAALLREPRRLLEFAQLLTGSAQAMTERVFRSEAAKIWLIGNVLHSDLAPEDAGGGAFGLLLCGVSQRIGMPIPRGGAQAIPDALRRLLEAHGGQVLSGRRVDQIVVRKGRAVAVRSGRDEIRARKAILSIVQPQGLFLDLVGAGHLPPGFVKLVRRFRWGDGAFQLNLALADRPRFRAEALRDALVVHLARSVGETSRGKAASRREALPEHPMLVAGTHTLVDPTRAPPGQHTLWLMTHVPTRIRDDAGGTIAARTWTEAKEPFTERVLDELEAYAPGLRGLVLAAHARTPDDVEAENANLVGGDIGSGSYTLDQQLVFRPFPGWFRYQTPIRGLYMSGAATHPGGGVHGAAGANAARVMLADLRLAGLREQVETSVVSARERLQGLIGRAASAPARSS